MRKTSLKKAIIATIAIIGLALMTNFAYAKSRKVTVCTSYFVGATNEMTCSGHFNGKATIVGLYNKGWRYIGNISNVAHKFVLIFEK